MGVSFRVGYCFLEIFVERGGESLCWRDTKWQHNINPTKIVNVKLGKNRAHRGVACSFDVRIKQNTHRLNPQELQIFLSYNFFFFLSKILNLLLK